MPVVRLESLPTVQMVIRAGLAEKLGSHRINCFARGQAMLETLARLTGKPK